MTPRELLSPQIRASLFDPPTDAAEIVRHYTFSAEDMGLIRQRRRPHNRLGFAVHLAYLRFPGRVLAPNETPPPAMLGYPAVLAELWSKADHQLCVFHIIKEINKLTLDAVRRLRAAMSRRGRAGRKKKRHRKGAKSKAAARRGLTVKEKSSFVFKHRHLIVKRRENLTESERDDLKRMA